MRALPTEEVPADLTESHMLVKACDMYDVFHEQLGEEDLRDARAVSGLAKVMSGSLIMCHSRLGVWFDCWGFDCCWGAVPSDSGGVRVYSATCLVGVTCRYHRWQVSEAKCKMSPRSTCKCGSLLPP